MSAGLSVTGAVSGCGGDHLDPGKVVPPSELYWALELNHHAVTMATAATPPYDTLTLVATPRAVDGTPLDGLPAVTYRSLDPDKVVVTADGVVHGGGEPTSTWVQVVATLTAGNLRHADTALVKVVALDGPPPVLDSFSIHPIPGVEGYVDSTKVGGFGFGVVAVEGEILTTTCFELPIRGPSPFCANLLPVRVLDVTGNPIPDVLVMIRSSDREAVQVNNLRSDRFGHISLGDGSFTLSTRLPPSKVMLYGSTTVFGIAKADTLPLQIGWPVFVPTTVRRTGFENPVLKVGTGAIVAWINNDSSAVDINFADPTNVAKATPTPSFLPPLLAFNWCQGLALCEDAGNVVLSPLSGGLGAMRRFPVPGIYDYSSTALGGASGRIIVVDER